MTKGHDKFYDGRDAAFRKLLEFATKGGVQARCIEEYDNLKFEELESEVTGLLESESQEGRLELNFKLALLRSLRYAVAGSRHCLVLGVVGGMRELYEGRRLVHPLEEIKKE